MLILLLVVISWMKRWMRWWTAVSSLALAFTLVHDK